MKQLKFIRDTVFSINSLIKGDYDRILSQMIMGGGPLSLIIMAGGPLSLMSVYISGDYHEGPLSGIINESGFCLCGFYLYPVEIRVAT